MTTFWVGTSGYNYREWRGHFYPEELSEQQMLRYYAERFPAVEINYTFYRQPTVRVLQAWAKETPDRFVFALKAPRRITHDLRLRDAADPLAYFCETAQALKGRLGPILFQLPPFLKKDTARLEDFLHQVPPGIRAAFEFRNQSWFADDVFECLRRFEAALCVAEGEERNTPCEVTTGFGYFRLRKPDYGDEALAAWAERIRAVPEWTDAFVYFKHEDEGRGPQLAARFRSFLDGQAPAAAAAKRL